MSRAMNINLDVPTVRAKSAQNNATISAIEAILSGGTRVVFMNMSDADRMRGVFSKALINGTVVRTKWVRNA